MMIGGDKAVVDRLDPIFATLAPGIGDIPRTPGREGRDPRVEQGYIHAGPVGAGHFVKMIHNGIEYGLMQAYAEGFDILKNANIEALPAEHRFDLDIADIAEVWRRGSVIPSWLLDLTASALAENQTLDNYSGFVEDSGEGRWTVNAAIDEAVPAEVLTAALYARFRSRKDHTFAEKILSAMRAGFGGHKEPPKKTRREGLNVPWRSVRLAQKKPDPCSFVIFGVTGDLDAPAGRSLPSIISRPADLLPDKFCVVGVARKGMSSDELRDSLMKGLRQFATRAGGRCDRQAPAGMRHLHRGRSEGAGLVRRDEQAARRDSKPREKPAATACSIWRRRPTRSCRSAANSAAPACWRRTARGGGWWSKSRSAPTLPRPRR